MTSMLVAATIAALSFTTHTDTTVSVAQGARLELDNYGGDMTVETWAKNAVHIEADHGSHVTIHLEREGGALKIEAEQGRYGPAEVDYHLTVPAWMALHLSGVYTDITVTGSRNEVRAETVKGDVEVTGGRGFVSLSSVEGGVKLSDASGHIELNSVNDDVAATNLEGDLSIQCVNGDLHLDRVRCTTVDASTVNGSIAYAGDIRTDGRYHFATHSGDILVAIPDKASLGVSVSTFSGDFDSTFPIKLNETKAGRRFKFTLGTGTGDLELESFEGTIRLSRPGEPLESIDEDSRDHQIEKEKQVTKTKQKEKTKTEYKYKEKGGDKDGDKDDDDGN